MICENLTLDSDSNLLFAGRSLRELASIYGTPLYVMDEDRIRKMCRTYQEAMLSAFGENALPLYASKACSFKRMYRIMAEEKMGVDVVSAGEIATAKSAGFDLALAYFHGNNKTDAEIRFAMESGVGYFVVDNEEEIDAIDQIGAEIGKAQKILLRITPGIDTHTYEAIATGQVDSKFGSAIETGQAMAITKKTLSKKFIKLVGFHCHVGSQVFDSDTFLRSAEIMMQFLHSVRAESGFLAEELSLGGGYGVRYTEEDPVMDLKENIAQVGEKIKALCNSLSYPQPKILMEPGRSIVADAGITLYTVGTVKKIPGYKTYVSVDGGMTDNPRFALYGAVHTPVCPEKMAEKKDMKCSVVGRCCESGDILCGEAYLPSSVKRGDLLALLTTGAYNYSMASHYNRVPNPPVVMLSEGKDFLAVKRETPEDLIRLDV